jgi:methyl-accepting chemotaxis protein
MNEELKIIIRAELEQFKKAMRDAVSGLKSVANESRKTSKEVDGFTADVNQQGKALSDLKRKYIDLAAAHGKESKEAKDAAEAIKKLSAEYKTNKALANDLANNANSFDLSLGEGGKKNVDDTNESVQELQGSLEAIRNLDFAGVMLSAFGPELREHLSKAKAEFEEMATHARYTFTGLFKNGSYYKETGEEWTGFGDAIKGAFESGSEAGKTFARGMKEVGAAVSKAMSGIVGVLLVVIADLIILIGLTKNALTMAKQIKTEAAEASKLGLTTQSYQEWGYVLEQVGVGADKLSDFLKTLADEQNAVRDGSEDIVKAFEAIGLSQEEVMGMDQQTLFRETVRGLQNVENAAERTSIAYRIFGEDAAELANVLYLNNQETQSLIDNYYNLGAAPSDNLINKSKILTGSTTNLSYAWQGLKNTLAEWVIPAVISVVQWITTAVAYINAFLQGIFGVKTQSKDAAKGMENIGKGTDKIGSGAKNATKAVKELLRYTMGFDELNIIPKQSKSDSDSDSGAGAGAGAYSSMGINPDMPVIETPDLSKFREFMDEYGSLIQGLLTWGAILGGLAMLVGGIMTGNIPLIVAGASVIGLGIGIGAAGGEESHWAKFAEGFMNVFGGLLASLKPAWDAICNVFKAAWELIKTIWDGVKPYFEGLWLYIKLIFSVVQTVLGTYFALAWEYIKVVWNAAVGFFASIWNTIAGVFSVVKSVLRGNFKDAWEAIKGIVGTWVGYFKGIWNSIKKAFSNVKSFLGGAFGDAVENVKEKWGDLKNFFADIINGVIDIVEKGINFIIKQINKLSWNVPDWVPIIGGEKWGFNFKTISIPRLAEGGIATSSVLANIGERGREAVLPLENNTGWMDMLADRINGRNNTPSRIILAIDGKELGYATINSINDITRQTGTLQLQMI